MSEYQEIQTTDLDPLKICKCVRTWSVSRLCCKLWLLLGYNLFSLSPQFVSDLHLALPHVDITFSSPAVEFSGAGLLCVSVMQFCVTSGDVVQTVF